MKIWTGYGSEHSSNLVMIGRFKEAGDAAKVKEIIESICEQVRADERAGLIKFASHQDRYTEGMLNLLMKLNFTNVGSSEIEQFCYDVNVEINNGELVLTTEEADVSAFLKLLINEGARVEVYSAHNYPDTGKGRGK